MSYDFREGHFVRFKSHLGKRGRLYRVMGTRDNGFEVYLEPVEPDLTHPWCYTYYDQLEPEPVSLLEVLAEVSQ
jgi:hypothetical protein